MPKRSRIKTPHEWEQMQKRREERRAARSAAGRASQSKSGPKKRSVIGRAPNGAWLMTVVDA